MKHLHISVNSKSSVFKPGSIVRIGRSAEAEVRIDAPEISRIHGTFTFDESLNNWIYVDNDSANGSFIDGKRISQYMVVKPKPLFIGVLENLIEVQLSIDEIAVAETAPQPVEEITKERKPIQLPKGTYTCGYCTGPINYQFGPRCPACDALIHKECWIEFEGCITFGCSENPDMKAYGR